jgi:transposase
MGRSDNVIGDTPVVIPFRRVPFPVAPLCMEASADFTKKEACMKDNRRARTQYRFSKHPTWSPLLKRIQPDAAGIDCGATSHFVAVPADRDPQPVREFSTFTPGLQQLADWLVQCGIKTVAMESTGVYWIPVYEVLEQRGIEVVLVNAHHVHNVRGRKSDIQDCQWLQELHSVGLLYASFRPAGAIVTLRSYVRHRQTLVESAATCINRMQKALDQMNLKLHHVLSDLTGVTGMAIVRDILAGVRDPHKLAAHRHGGCKASEQQIAAALTGNYRAEHMFALRQNFEALRFHQKQITRCDREIEAQLASLAESREQPSAELPAARPRCKPSKNEPRVELRTPLHRITGGADLSQIDGIGPYGALQLIAEIGTDMSRWRTEKHFTGWLTLAPNNKTSARRLLSSRTQPSANRAAAVLRRAAMSLTRSATALGAYYRRVAYRLGQPKAITATARKLAVLVYRVLRGDITYQDPGATAYLELHRTRLINSLRRRATELGLSLINLETGEVLDHAVVP